MPEGHSVHRHARELRRRLAGSAARLASPQGRFAAGAAALDGEVLARTEAHGKHLLLRFDRQEPDRWVHVHLGLFGRWSIGDGAPPEVRGAIRLRLTRDDGGSWADLRGPTACELLDDAAVAALRARLGPDPLRSDADPNAARRRIAGSRSPIGQLLLRQDVVAGVGNVYRAEALFRQRLDPRLPGRELGAQRWDALWGDLVGLLGSGVRTGRIVTTEPGDRERPRGRVARADAHYVYRRQGLPCRRCGTPVAAADDGGRRLYWCPGCQRP